MTNKNQNQYCNSNAKVKRLAATPEQKQKNRRRYVPCGNSLYVKVQPSGFKTYIGKMRHPVKQTQLEYKVGRCDDMDFDTARRKFYKYCLDNDVSPSGKGIHV